MYNERLKEELERKVTATKSCYYNEDEKCYNALAMSKKHGIKKEVCLKFDRDDVQDILSDRALTEAENECRKEFIKDINYSIKECAKLIGTMIVSFSLGFTSTALIIRAITKFRNNK